MIQIKNELVLQELLAYEVHPILMDLVVWFFDLASNIFITSGHRPGDSGVHGQLPFRGIDFRIRIYEPGQAETFVILINSHWEYDPYRPNLKCAVLHGEGPNKHIHLQVHPNTRRI